MKAESINGTLSSHWLIDTRYEYIDFIQGFIYHGTVSISDNRVDLEGKYFPIIMNELQILLGDERKEGPSLTACFDEQAYQSSSSCSNGLTWNQIAEKLIQALAPVLQTTHRFDSIFYHMNRDYFHRREESVMNWDFGS